MRQGAEEEGSGDAGNACAVAVPPPAASIASGGLPGDVGLALTETIEPVAGSRAGWGTYAALLGSHAFIDIFPIFFTSLMIVFEERFALTGSERLAIYMISPIFSGTLQPLFAWLTDRFDTRLCGPIGLALGAVCCGSIGFAESFEQLIALQMVGVIGTGMYHPIMTAVAGRLGGRFVSGGRAVAIGVFIAAGMVGQSIGPILSTEVNEAFGMKRLAWLIVPGLVLALILHVLVGRVKHRHDGHAAHHAQLSFEDRRARWRLIASLTAQNALRFTTNVALFNMFNEWATRKIVAAPALLADPTMRDAALKAVAANKALIVGKLSAAMTIGMGISVILAPRIFKAGNEKAPLVWMSMVGALFAASVGLVGDAVVPEARELARIGGALMVLEPVTLLTMLPVCACAALSSIGFFATFPIAASLAQRLMPAHTGLATSFMMGTGWAISAVSAPIAALLVHGSVTHATGAAGETWRIHLGFGVFAALLVLAGLLAATMPSRLLHAVRDDV